MTETATITLSPEDANALISAACRELRRLDHSIKNGEYISISWQGMAEERRDRLHVATLALRHAYRAAQK